MDIKNYYLSFSILWLNIVLQKRKIYILAGVCDSLLNLNNDVRKNGCEC